MGRDAAIGHQKLELLSPVRLREARVLLGYVYRAVRRVPYAQQKYLASPLGKPIDRAIDTEHANCEVVACEPVGIGADDGD